MGNAVAYRCLNCLDHTITRTYSVSHLSVTCPECDSFQRFVNDGVYEQFQDFEADPPAELDWDRLDRREKLVISERVARRGTAVEDIAITE